MGGIPGLSSDLAESVVLSMLRKQLVSAYVTAKIYQNYSNLFLLVWGLNDNYASECMSYDDRHLGISLS